MWVTAYTDASYHVSSGGAWAVWLRSERGRIVRKGKCPGAVDSSTAAEFYAAYMAVRIAREEWADIEGVQVNSDCMNVVRGMYPWSKISGSKWTGFFQRAVMKFLKDSGMKVKGRHIKGHQNKNKGVREWLNNKVDEMAGEARRS